MASLPPQMARQTEQHAHPSALNTSMSGCDDGFHHPCPDEGLSVLRLNKSTTATHDVFPSNFPHINADQDAMMSALPFPDTSMVDWLSDDQSLLHYLDDNELFWNEPMDTDCPQPAAVYALPTDLGPLSHAEYDPMQADDSEYQNLTNDITLVTYADAQMPTTIYPSWLMAFPSTDAWNGQHISTDPSRPTSTVDFSTAQNVINQSMMLSATNEANQKYRSSCPSLGHISVPDATVGFHQSVYGEIANSGIIPRGASGGILSTLYPDPDYQTHHAPADHLLAAIMSDIPAACEKKPQTGKLQPRIPPDTLKILLERFTETPYPKPDQVDLIALQTGLKVSTVGNWFMNFRSRHGSKRNAVYSDNRESLADPCTANHIAPSATRLSRESLERLSREPSPDQQPPLEAWMSSSFQSELVATTDLEAALATFLPGTSLDCSGQAGRSASRPHTWAASVRSSRASSRGSGATRLSADTETSTGSNSSALSRTRRRGRKLFRSTGTGRGATNDKPKDERWYMCTYCGDRFRQKYDWKRHEEAVHLQLETWVCCLHDIPASGPCPYCPYVSLDDKQLVAHIEEHGFSSFRPCPEEERTFYRRDNFIGHVHKIHTFGQKHPSPDLHCNALAALCHRPAPDLPVSDPALHCGFCGERFATWQTRCDHVSHHFSSESRDMSSWWTDRLPNTLRSNYNFYTPGPWLCLYCKKEYADGRHSHSSCQIWSCRFLHSLVGETGVSLLPGYATTDYLRSYRACTQEFYGSLHEFRWHLVDFHGANCLAVECDEELNALYSREKKAIFEYAKPLPIPQPSSSAPPQASKFCFREAVLRTKRRLSRENQDEAEEDIGIVRSPSTSSSDEDSLHKLSNCRIPRFFHTDPLSLPRIFYSNIRDDMSVRIAGRSKRGLVEVSHRFMGSLIASSTLVGMAGAGLIPRIKMDRQAGIVDFSTMRGKVSRMDSN